MAGVFIRRDRHECTVPLENRLEPPPDISSRSPAIRERWSCSHLATVNAEPTTEQTRIGSNVRVRTHVSMLSAFS